MLRVCRFVLLLSWFCMPLYAQNSKMDQLTMRYYSATLYEEKRNALIALCENVRMLPIDSFEKYVQELLRITSNGSNANDKLISQYYAALYYLKVGKLDSLLYYYKQQEPHFKEYPKLEMKFLTVYGSYCVKKNNHEAAFSNFYKSLRMAEEQADTLMIIKNKLSIGWTHMEMMQYEQALKWFRAAADVSYEEPYQMHHPTIYNNMASCFGGLGKFDSARLYCTKSLDLSIKNNDLSTQANANFILGNLYVIEKKFTDAERVFFEGYRIHQQIGDPFYIVSDMAQLAVHFCNTRQFDKGIEMGLASIDYAKRNQLDSKLLVCYDALSINYKESNRWKEYAGALDTMNILRDSIYSKTSVKEVAEMNTMYETEKKEKLIQQQKFEITKRNYWLFGGIGIFLLTLLVGVLFYRNRKQQHDKQLQIELLKQQDIASKAVIEAEENERTRIAADLHDGIGQMLTAVKMNLEGLTGRISIQNKEDAVVYEKVKWLVEESCKEVRNVSHNIMPNALIKSGLGNAIKDFIDKVQSEKLAINLSVTGIHESLHSNVEIVVYRIIQECVNNVIKHAQSSKLDISLIRDHEGLHATIEDNGIGFNVSSLQKAKGIGMKNIKTRVDYLKGTLDIDSSPGRGTLIAFTIPLNEPNT